MPKSFTNFTNKSGDIIVCFENELKINGKVILSQRDENEGMEASASWIQEYSNIFWKTIIEGSLEKEFNGKLDLASIVEDLAIFIEDIKQ